MCGDRDTSSTARSFLGSCLVWVDFFTVQLSREYAFFGFAADRLTFEEVDSASPPRSNRRPLHPKLRPGDLCETSFRVAVVSSCWMFVVLAILSLLHISCLPLSVCLYSIFDSIAST